MDILIDTIPEELTISEEIKEVIRQVIATMAKLYDLSGGEVSIIATNNEYIQTLNKEYRHIDSATDVLSFALRESIEEPDIIDAPTESLGDIVISLERAAEQAKEYGHSFQREVAFLTLHGMLHLLGYDHLEDSEREEMEQEQRFILRELGYI